MNPLIPLRRLRAALLAGACAALPGLCHADAPASPEPAIARTLASMRAAGFSGAVVTGNSNTIRFAQAVGMADLASGRPLLLSDVWPWASVSKQVTAILVMQEVEKARIGLDQPVVRYLPAFKGGDAITIRQLLLHTSGLANPDDTPAAPGQMPAFYLETGAAIGETARAHGYCSGVKTASAAGFEYNNCDYLVLGAVLEKVTGRPYSELIRTRLHDTLSLTSLGLAPDALRAGRIRGYTDAATPAPPANVATLGAAGALTGTALDLFALDQAIINGKLLGEAANAEMTRGDPKAGYAALGVWSFPAKLAGCAAPVALVERRGDFAGIQVRNLIAPGLKRALVVFTNHGDIEFGELWQGRGPAFDLASAAFCGEPD